MNSYLYSTGSATSAVKTARREVEDAQFAKRHVFPDEVDVQLVVLRSSVVDGVLAHVDGGDVVTVGHRGAGNVAVKLAKKLPHPYAFAHGVRHGPVLGFRA